MNTDQVKRIQIEINNSGIDSIAVDGVYGPKTESAYKELMRLSSIGGMFEEVPVPVAAKPWWTSRALIGGISTILVGLAGLAGWSIDTSGTTEIIFSIATLVAGILSYVGTIKRKAPIDSTLVAPGVRISEEGFWSKNQNNPFLEE